MVLSLKYLGTFMLLTFLGQASLANPVLNRAILPATHGGDMAMRAANTCADPSLAAVVFEAFSGNLLAHYLDFHYAFVNADSKQPAAPPLWTLQGPMFKAWPTQQPFTVPLFTLHTPNGLDYIFMVGADAQTPPVVGGFTGAAIIAWVYDTAVCDAVPLMTAVLATASDHYYTTDPQEHAALLANGWTDGGVVAYVLPLASL